MALQLATLDPTATEPAPTGYWRIVQTNFDFANETGLIVVYGYRDEASRDAGKQPLQAYQLQLTPGGQPAVTAPVTGAVLQPAIPAFNDLLTQLQTQYDALKAAFYTLIASQPQFTGATTV